MVQINLLTRLFSFQTLGLQFTSLQQAAAAQSLQEAKTTTASLQTVEATVNKICNISTPLVSVFCMFSALV